MWYDAREFVYRLAGERIVSYKAQSPLCVVTYRHLGRAGVILI
jgi:hypothetical protein